MTAANRVIGFTGPSRPLQVFVRELPDLQPDQARVRVGMAGICGSDAHRLAGDLTAPSEPIAFGHEAIGTIVALGSTFTADTSGTPLAIGDRVFWSSMTDCGRCSACTVRREPAQCATQIWPVPVDRSGRAAYQETATLDRTVACARVPEGVSDEAVLAFGCAMPTALGGMRRLSPVDAGGTVVIQGCGPVGLAFTVLASLGLADRVIVIGANRDRLAAARRLGATHVIDLDATTPAERASAVSDLTAGGGADIVVEAAGVLSAFSEALTFLGPSGQCLIAGLYSGKGTVTVDPVRLNNLTQTIIGSLGYLPRDIAGTVAVAASVGVERQFADLVSHRYALDDTETGIRSAAQTIKSVVTPSVDTV